jgi:predicted aldo/keto reductase-like oxidoreductase
MVDATEAIVLVDTPDEDESPPITELLPEDRVDMAGLSVSRLGIGTWAWGDTMVWQYSESMDAELQQVFDLCVRQGINFFDTAEVYGLGRSEYLCGKFKREFQGPQVRTTALLCTLQLLQSFVVPFTSDSCVQ